MKNEDRFSFTNIKKLMHFDTQFIREEIFNYMLDNKKRDIFLREKYNSLNKWFKVKNWIKFFEEYSELIFYFHLKKMQGCDVDVRFIKPSSQKNTPDFQVSIDEYDFFIEVKAPDTKFKGKIDGQKFRNVFSETRENEAKILEGKQGAVIFSNFSGNSASSYREKIEFCIDKIVGMVDGQFKKIQENEEYKGRIIYAFNISRIDSPYIISNMDLFPLLHLGNDQKSGFLWNIAFARKGEIICDAQIEAIQGGINLFGELINREGILQQRKNVDAVIFFDSYNVFALFKDDINKDLKKAIVNIVGNQNFNDEYNSNFLKKMT